MPSPNNSVPAASRKARVASNAAVIIPDDSEDEFYDGAVPPTTQQPLPKSGSKAKQPAKPAAKPASKPAAKPKKRKKPVSDSGSGSDSEFVPSADASEEEDSAEEEDGASEEEEEKLRKRAAGRPQPEVTTASKPKRPRAGGGTSGASASGGTRAGGGSSSLLCPPATAAAGEGAELTVDAAWYGDASDVWGDAGEFVTEQAAALVSGRELRLNPHGAAGWYNARFGDAAPGCEKVLALRYRYGADGSPQEARSLPGREERCALLVAPQGATVRLGAHGLYYLAELTLTLTLILTLTLTLTLTRCAPRRTRATTLRSTRRRAAPSARCAAS